jgi:hypothetical protein
MTKRPDLLPIPSIDAYPYIRIVFENIDCAIPGEPPDATREGPHVVRDEEYFYDGATPPLFDTHLTAPIALMSDQTLEALCAAMRPAIYGEFITSRQSLEDLARRKFETIMSQYQDTASPEQVQCFLLVSARTSLFTQWAKIADLYNGASDDQKQAIYRYFENCLNRDLGQLLTIQAPVFDVPASLTPSFESKKEGEQTLVFDAKSNGWIREDIFLGQFAAYATDSRHQDRLLAVAPTMELAFARATLAVRNFDGVLKQVTLTKNGNLLAQGEVAFTGGNHPHIKNQDPRITWEPEDNERVGITRREVLRALFAAETAIGMEWSKVRRLEDDLGM